ncbi:MAG: helix-turn-helix transcriptional regulator [Kiloniellales bacterium]|nr:helix-turn-helix transcriptional regulator [Kiloniellales bacterium]
MRLEPDEERLDRLVKSIYATLGGGDPWPDVLDELCDVFDGRGATLTDHNFGSRRGAIRFKCDHFDDAVPETYKRRMCSRNPWLHSDLPYRPRSVILGTEILPDAELTRTEFYQEYLHPLGLKHRLCGVVHRDGLGIRFLAILRAPRQPAFEESDKARLRRLLPHFQQSFDLRRHLLQERSEREALLEVLDHIPVACMLVNQGATLHFVNNAATRLLERRDGLLLRAGGLAASSSRLSTQLRSAIAKVASCHPAQGGNRGEHFVVSRPSGRPPLLLSLQPVHQSQVGGAAEPEALVAILTKDPDGEQLESVETFAEAYGLTEAEARLIGLLAEGSSLFEAAATLGVSKNTARTHMRHIYAKVGAHRQADLIRLLAKLGSA